MSEVPQRDAHTRADQRSASRAAHPRASRSVRASHSAQEWPFEVVLVTGIVNRAVTGANYLRTRCRKRAVGLMQATAGERVGKEWD